jgi:intracellular multiplication protein IcmO
VLGWIIEYKIKTKNKNNYMAIPEHLLVDKKALGRDIRPMPVKIKAWFNDTGLTIILIMLFVAMWFPQISQGVEFVLLFLLLFCYFCGGQVNALPFKKPISSKELDPNEKHPGTGKPMKADGIHYYGNDINNSKQIWFNASDVKTHTLIFGTTGSGKTEALVSICANALTQCSGFIYVDGKGDSSLFMKLFSMVRYFLREDDFLIINFMTGGSFDPNKKTTEMMSNTMNPFSAGSASALSELINSLLPGGDGGGDMWRGRAASFMTSLMRVLVALREENKLFLDVNTIRQFFELRQCEELINRTDIDPVHLDGLKQYVLNLPGYDSENDEQEFDVLQQHGFITMQFTEIFGMLADEYGHIMKTQLGEVDFFDVVVNRRILVVLLPALEKSSQSLTNLGKIIVASVRSMMSSALGAQLEGTRADVIDRKPTNAPSPYLTIFDEYGYYSTEGAAVMPAQARSLGFSMIFAGQDYQAFKKGSAEEAASIVANCAIKICMKLEDPTETFDIFFKAGGKDKIAAAGGFQKDQNSSTGAIRDTGSVSIVDKDRFSIESLKAQTAGQAHIMFGDKVVQSKFFYADPKPLNEARLNTFLKVYPPSFEEVDMMKKGLIGARRKFNSILDAPANYQVDLKKALKNTGISSELTAIFKGIKLAKGLNSVIAAFFSLITYIEKIKIVDNKILTESRKGFEEYYKAQEKKKDSEESYLNIDESDLPDEDEDDDDAGDTNSMIDDIIIDEEPITETNVEECIEKPGHSPFIGRLKGLISKKRGQFGKMIPTSPFKKLNPKEDEIHKNVKTLEKDINKVLKEKGVYDNDDILTEEYAELSADKTITDINIATAIDRKQSEMEKTKTRNEAIIKGILNDFGEE